jgi:hypothetical protein
MDVLLGVCDGAQGLYSDETAGCAPARPRRTIAHDVCEKEPSLPYLHCGRCGLQIRIQAEYLRVDNCPRCLARTATATAMILSSIRVDPAVGWGPGSVPVPDDNVAAAGVD